MRRDTLALEEILEAMSYSWKRGAIWNRLTPLGTQRADIWSRDL